MLSFLFWLLNVRFCAHQGSKRTIGTFDGLMFGALFGILGTFVILSSRRLDDHKANADLIQKLKPIALPDSSD
jgi:hypothetical protein